MFPADGQISRTFPSDHAIQMHIEDNWAMHRSTRSQSSLTLSGRNQDLKTDRNAIKWTTHWWCRAPITIKGEIGRKSSNTIKAISGVVNEWPGLNWRVKAMSSIWRLVLGENVTFQKVMQSLSRCRRWVDKVNDIAMGSVSYNWIIHMALSSYLP